MKKNLVSLFAITILASFDSIEAEVSYDYYFGSAFCAKPIRMEELDGAMIVRLSQEKNRFVPVLYPGRQTLFQWIDSGDVNLLTYEQYLRNPKPYIKPSPVAKKSLFTVSTEPENKSGEKNRLSDSVISSGLLRESGAILLPPLPQPRMVVLPGDRELQSFLVRNRAGEKDAPIEKPSVSNQMIPPPPSRNIPVKNPLSFQGQVFGFSTGATVTDENCERLKLSKYLYDTGMKVASVSILCQDPRVFKAMEMAGTPCPYQGQIGKEATKAWAENKSKRPDAKEQEKLFIQQCTHDRNPNRDKINKDVVGAVKVIYTTKTKTKRQCKKEFYATQ